MPSEDDQVYELIADPPFDGADHETESDPCDGDDAEGAPGVAGTVVAVTAADAPVKSELPFAFVTRPWNV